MLHKNTNLYTRHLNDNFGCGFFLYMPANLTERDNSNEYMTTCEQMKNITYNFRAPHKTIAHHI